MDRNNRPLKVAHRGREGKGTVITFCLVLEIESSEKDAIRTKTDNTTDRSTTPSNQRLQSRARRRAQGIRVRYGVIRARCATSDGVS